MTPTEHILLEAESPQVPQAHEARRSHGCTVLRSRLRPRVLTLEIIDYYYLCVRSQSRSRHSEFTLDLRFVRTPQLTRHIAWAWIGAMLVLVAFPVLVVLTVVGIAPLRPSSPWQQHALALSIGLGAASVCAAVVGSDKTTETVILTSTYGVARLLEFTGGLGTFRAARPFLSKLAAHIRLASGARRRTKAEHLRDEMREHLRLREIGALSRDEYEASKTRILEQHAPGRR
jgi:hypothetical protein